MSWRATTRRFEFAGRVDSDTAALTLTMKGSARPNCSPAKAGGQGISRYGIQPGLRLRGGAARRRSCLPRTRTMFKLNTKERHPFLVMPGSFRHPPFRMLAARGGCGTVGPGLRRGDGMGLNCVLHAACSDRAPLTGERHLYPTKPPLRRRPGPNWGTVTVKLSLRYDDPSNWAPAFAGVELWGGCTS